MSKLKRFAVASKNGVTIDAHFGHVTEFSVYEVDEKSVAFIEKRQVEQFCGGSDNCGSFDERINRVISTLADCSGVVVQRIGQPPAAALEQSGIQVFISADEIKSAIINVVEGKGSKAY